MKNNEKYNIVV